MDAGGKHAECAFTIKNTMRIHQRWTSRTRKSSVAELEFSARVEGVMILFEAKSMVIDFGGDVGCVTHKQQFG